MGVDARMFVKVKSKENWIDEKTAIDYSYQLGSTLGHETFFNMYGADDSLFNETRHALEIVPKVKDSEYPEDVLDDYPNLGNRYVIHQDSMEEPFVVAEKDEQFIEVHLSGRYYGPGYERGNWSTLYFTIQMLRNLFPNGEVYYGGDSNGVLFELMDDKNLKVFNDHFFNSGHRPYQNGFGRSSETRPECTHCNNTPMSNFGGGGADEFYSCLGCGKKIIHNGITNKNVVLRRHEDFFDAVNLVRNGAHPNL